MATSGGALSSVGRASRLHREGRRFEPVSAHHEPSFRSRVGASDPSSRERTFHADQTRWLVPLRRGSLFGTQSYAGSVLALLFFDLSQTAGGRGLCDQPRLGREVAGIVRDHVVTPVTNALNVCRLLLDKKTYADYKP